MRKSSQISDFYEQFAFQLNDLKNSNLKSGPGIQRSKNLEAGIAGVYIKADSGFGMNRVNLHPEVIITKSPMACQLVAFMLDSLDSHLYVNKTINKVYCDQSRREWNGDDRDIWSVIEKDYLDQWESNFINKISEFVSFSMWNDVFTIVKTALFNYISYSKYQNNYNSLNVDELCRDTGRREAILYENELLSEGIFEMILLKDFCIVCELPSRLTQNSHGQLHSKDNSAVEWSDGFGLYYWNGIKVPREWIVNKEIINNKTILSERNIERRRCLMEILGTNKYFDLLNVACIDSAMDDHGLPIKLYRTKDKEPTINEYLYYLFVVDPSTKIEYFIPVPPSYDVHWAKAATFNHKKIQYRQGDVGLLNLEVPFSSPSVET